MLDFQAFTDLIIWMDQQECYYRRNAMSKELKVMKDVRSKLAKVMEATTRRRKGWDK